MLRHRNLLGAPQPRVQGTMLLISLRTQSIQIFTRVNLLTILPCLPRCMGSCLEHLDLKLWPSKEVANQSQLVQLQQSTKPRCTQPLLPQLSASSRISPWEWEIRVPDATPTHHGERLPGRAPFCRRPTRNLGQSSRGRSRIPAVG